MEKQNKKQGKKGVGLKKLSKSHLVVRVDGKAHIKENNYWNRELQDHTILYKGSYEDCAYFQAGYNDMRDQFGEE